MRSGGQRLVEAGAVLTAEVAGEGADTVTARSYAHPALAGRKVVRLVPKGLGPAEDLAMEFLGFTSTAEPVEVGTGRRQALGFPAWALVHDPVNGHHALALVKEIERLNRLARSKPGHAKDGFEELAARLGASVPHFLPTFYEQAGRAFVAVENRPMAAMMFGRAREAEQVHALPIDEDRQRDVFLEFAFSGALSAKAMTQHARDLARRADPEQAYELFLRICLERVAGGLPPYTGMTDDLRRLARAAGLKVAEQDDRVVSALLETPALARAPLGFWRAYTPAITRLARAGTDVRGQLLAMFPALDLEGTEELWFDLLEATGAIEGLTAVGGDEGLARPRDGVAGWLERATNWRARGWRSAHRSPRWLALVERMADRLRAEGRPLDLEPPNRPWDPDLDLIDLCLALGLEVRPTTRRHLPLDEWMRDPAPGRRDLVALCSQDWARPLVRTGIDQVLQTFGYRPDLQPLMPLDRLRPLLDQAGPRSALAEWLRRIASDVESGALPAMKAALDRLTRVSHAEVLAVEPRAVAALRAADPGRALARTLRIGLLDEFGWPALEEAVLHFPAPAGRPGGREPFELRGAWPGVVLANEARAVAVGPAGILATHDVRYPADHRPDLSAYGPAAEFVDGQFLVVWRSQAGPVMAYWSARPAEVFEVDAAVLGGRIDDRVVPLPLPSGGRATGGRPFVAGDRSFADRWAVAGDGVAWYRFDARGWREFDPATGDGGRDVLPAFFAAGLDSDGVTLDHLGTELAPVPAGCEQSPLGTADDLLGWRAVSGPGGAATGTSVAGASLTLTPAQVEQFRPYRPAGVLRRPDGSEVGLLTHHGSVAFWDGECVGSEYVVGRRASSYAGGSAYVLPPMWWHALRPRDVAGSGGLRAVTDEQGRRLAGAGPAAIAEVLPGVSHPGLVAGITSAVGIAQGCAEARATILDRAGQPETTGRPEVGGVDETQLAEALAGLTAANGRYRSWYSASQTAPGTTVRLVEAAGARVAGAPETPVVPFDASVDWTCAVGGLGALALRAASAATPEADREALVALLEAIAGTPLAETDGRWRLVELLGEATQNPFGLAADPEQPGPGHVVRTDAGAAVVLHETHRWVGQESRRALVSLEFSASGEFGAVPGHTVGAARVHRGWGGSALIRELLDLIRTRGPAPWQPGAVGRLTELTGMTRPAAALVLGGLPRLDSTLHNFLDPGTREVLGLKVTEAVTARHTLSDALGPDSRLALGSLALPDRPADLWDHGPAVERIAQGWVKAFGRRLVVPEELVVEADSLLKGQGLPAADLLAGLVDPDNCRWLTVDEAFADNGYLDGDRLVSITAGLVWLAYRLPLDSLVRAGLPRALEALRARLSHRDVSVVALAGYDLGAIRQAYGHPRPVPGPNGARPEGRYELGDVGVIVDHGWSEDLYLHTAALSDPDDPVLKAAEGLFDPPSAALRLVAGPSMMRLLEGQGLPPAGWAQDPLLVAPDLVAQVVTELALDESAARMYLQVLALPDPTDKNVARWNGWPATQVRHTAGALLAAGVLVEGKRSRAGRRAFLPGGWLDVRAPMLPIEAWKVPLLGYLPDGRAPLGVSVAAVPAPELFAAAWARVRAGAGPALEELRTGRR